MGNIVITKKGSDVPYQEATAEDIQDYSKVNKGGVSH